MKFNNTKEMHNKYNQLLNEITDLCFRCKDIYGNDLLTAARLYEQYRAISDLEIGVISIVLITDQMETEKDKFIVQKETNSFIDSVFRSAIDTLINILHTWSLEDYRLRDWARRTAEFMEAYLDFWNEYI